MKKILSILFILLLACSLTGCGEKPEPVEDPGQQTDDVSQQPEEVSVFGVQSGNDYANEFFGFVLKLDDDWIYYNEEEIAQVNQTANDNMGEAYQELQEGSKAITDMIAQNPEMGSNIVVTLERVSALQSRMLTVEKYYEILQEQMFEIYADSPLEIKDVKNNEVTFLEEQLPGLLIEESINGADLKQQILILKEGDYFLSFTISGQDESDFQDILDHFYPY